MERKYDRFMRVMGGLVLALAGWTPATAGYPIAGIDPSQRPQGAPQITEVVKAPGWYTRALTGVSRPYPPSLKFLEDQGNWYTPFNRPGMPGRYDIRGWYAE
jgi:hypothetical protein